MYGDRGDLAGWGRRDYSRPRFLLPSCSNIFFCVICSYWVPYVILCPRTRMRGTHCV